MDEANGEDTEKINGRSPETIDGKTGLPIPPLTPKRRYRLKFSAVLDCRKAMVRVLHRLQKGRISNEDAKAQTYILATIRDTITACDIEAQLEAYRERMAQLESVPAGLLSGDAVAVPSYDEIRAAIKRSRPDQETTH